VKKKKQSAYANVDGGQALKEYLSMSN